MHTCKFTIIGQTGRKSICIPKALIENKYGPLEEDDYTFYTPFKNIEQSIILSYLSQSYKRKDNRRAI